MLAEQKKASMSDDEAARRIGDLELTEELTHRTLNGLQAEFKLGPKTITALTLIADVSSFLAPPPDELPSMSPPDVAKQHAMVKAAVEYVANMLQHLPNFLAMKITLSFDNSPSIVTENGWIPHHTDLHQAGSFRQQITYRNGHEVVEDPVPVAGMPPAHISNSPGLSSWGEFGQVLAVILTDSSKGQLTWSRWEQMNSGQAAVFDFKIPSNASHYLVDYCCVRHSEGPDPNHPWMGDVKTPNSYRGTPGYHGSLYIDPDSGTILRVTLQTELKSSDPITRSDMAVHYGPVEIGGKTYICPVKSVAISSARTGLETELKEWMILRVNDVTFTDYHRFGSSARILPSAPQ
jgi:hypothetical protein